MRITSQMNSTLVRANLGATMDRMLTLQNQASSGKRITRASDDPLGAGQALSLRSAVAGIEQYRSNTGQAKARLALVDGSLDNITKTLQDSKRLALAGANAATDPAQRQNLAAQVQQQIDSIVREANTQYMGRYAYGGDRTGDKPVTENPSGDPPYRYNGDDGVLSIPVNDSAEIPVSVTARQVLNLDGASDSSLPDTLSILTNLKKHLEAGDTDGLQTDMTQLESATRNVVSLRGAMGARAMQTSAYADRLDAAKVTMSDLQSQVEDVDFAETITQLQTEQNTYQAALLAMSRMMQPSLADYLK